MSDNIATSEPASEPSTGELVSQLSQQMSQLVRDELRLAQLEMAEKGKRAGLGVGLFGGAGLIALYGLGCMIAAAVLGLATGIPAWAAALIVGAVLFVIAGIASLIGKKEMKQATPPVPTEAVQGIQQDARTLKQGGTR
jgi:uncharacterized membrane protein YqjE